MAEIFTKDNCEYTQDWCHLFMVDWSWKRLVEHTLPTKKGIINVV